VHAGRRTRARRDHARYKTPAAPARDRAPDADLEQADLRFADELRRRHETHPHLGRQAPLHRPRRHRLGVRHPQPGPRMGTPRLLVCRDLRPVRNLHVPLPPDPQEPAQEPARPARPARHHAGDDGRPDE